MFVSDFASDGAYMHERLAQLEEKLVEQTEKAASHSEDTLVALHNDRKDILVNRAETASFAKQFSASEKSITNIQSQLAGFSKQLGDRRQDGQKQLAVLSAKLEQTLQTVENQQKDDQQSIASLKAAVNDLQSQLKQQNHAIQQTLASFSEQVRVVSENLSMDYASTRQDQQTLQKPLAELSFALGDQSEELLTALSEMKAQNRSLAEVPPLRPA